MKISTISDMHLGYGEGTEREEDAYRQAEEAIDKAIEKETDIILLAGDIFDEKTPTPETLSRAVKILKKPLLEHKGEVEIKKEGKEKHSQTHIPIIAIHGTHERRSKGYVNPIKFLEDAGYLTHLKCEKATVNVNGEEIAIHGMSGVPEKHTKTVLRKSNPQPTEGIPNIFMFHQSLEEYVYDPENTFLQVNDLPKGFDLYIDGHIHWHNILNNGKTMMFPGSTVITQMRKIESKKSKGFYITDTNTWDHKFIPLEKQRSFHYLEINLDGEKTHEVIEITREKLKETLKQNNKLKPLIKIKLKGTVSNETKTNTLPKERIKEDFDAIIKIDQDFKGQEFKQTIEDLRKSQREKRSIRDRGTDILKNLLEQSEYDSLEPENLMNSLSEKNPHQIADEIMDKYNEEKQKKTEKSKKITDF